jgi:hypothetical protein
MADRRGSRWREIIALAFLALATRVTVPPGFMPRTGGAPGLVICTGHGPATAPIRRNGPPSKSPSDKSDPHCAFGPSSATGMPVPIAESLPAESLASNQAQPNTRPDLAPGRGLAAPLPPSHGPPGHLTEP